MNPTAIRYIQARRIWDSRGRPTVEVDVTLAGGARGRGFAPAGASRGSREAVDLRDGGKALGGFDVQRAIANVAGPITKRIMGMDAMDQAAVDDALVALDGTPTKSVLGGNATIAVSLAVLHAAAAAAGQPLWRYLSAGKPVRMPLPQIQNVGGGAHACGRVEVQAVLFLPVWFCAKVLLCLPARIDLFRLRNRHQQRRYFLL